jgi:hypothetical protein
LVIPDVEDVFLPMMFLFPPVPIPDQVHEALAGLGEEPEQSLLLRTFLTLDVQVKATKMKRPWSVLKRIKMIQRIGMSTKPATIPMIQLIPIKRPSRK